MTLDHARAIEESERVTKMAKGRQVTRLANLSDPEVISKWFGSQFVPYDYQWDRIDLPGSSFRNHLRTSISTPVLRVHTSLG